MQMLIYISKVRERLTEGDLDLLLIESRASNESRGITGMLVYVEGLMGNEVTGRFMQMLEGPALELKEVFNKILNDERHYEVIVVKDQEISERNFQSWKMKFEQFNLSTHPEMIPFFNLDSSVLKSDEFKQTDIASEFMLSFV